MTMDDLGDRRKRAALCRGRTALLIGEKNRLRRDRDRQRPMSPDEFAAALTGGKRGGQRRHGQRLADQAIVAVGGSVVLAAGGRLVLVFVRRRIVPVMVIAVMTRIARPTGVSGTMAVGVVRVSQVRDRTGQQHGRQSQTRAEDVKTGRHARCLR
jgi:hypothetical protein